MKCSHPLYLAALLVLSGVVNVQAVGQYQLFFPTSGATRAFQIGYEDGNYKRIPLDHTFLYNNKYNTELYMSMDGFLAFYSSPPYDSDAIPSINKDIIAPLWCDIDIYTRGDITYQQATSGPLLDMAKVEIRRTFPSQIFTPTWIFVATWEGVFYEYDTGNVTFQVVLVSDDNDRSVVLMNYGSIAPTSQACMTGYIMENGNTFVQNVQSNVSSLASSTNVNIPGRWAFRWGSFPQIQYRLLFPSATQVNFHAYYEDGSYRWINFDRPFLYNNKHHQGLYLSMDGFLAFFSSPPYDSEAYSNINKDIIAPLWSDIDMYNRGKITYDQATSGPLLDVAEAEIDRTFPMLNFIPSWVFVATWEGVFFEVDTGDLTFQVILASDDNDHSLILMNYKSIVNTQQSWLSGYCMEDGGSCVTISADLTALTSTTNVQIPGRWAFDLNPSVQYKLLFPTGTQVLLNVNEADDGGFAQIQLDQPFLFNRNYFSELYLSMDGFISFFKPIVESYTNANINKDIIAPLWSDIETSTNRGNITYQQASAGPLLNMAKVEIGRTFPNLSFTPTWVFVATWEKVFFETDTGDLTFQAVLASDNSGNSVILMNYGKAASTNQTWLSGYCLGNTISFVTISVPSASDLSTTSNVAIPGRWAFKLAAVPEAQFSLLFPTGANVPFDPTWDDGSYSRIQLDRPFFYNNKHFSELYLSMDGLLAFFVPGIESYPDKNINQDIIAPLWSDIEIYNRGNITYRQASSGYLLDLAKLEISRTFPELSFVPSWVFIATWKGVFFEDDTGDLTFQAVLASDNDDRSVLLMNYGSIAPAQQPWLAGYCMQGHSFVTTSKGNISGLSSDSNVGIPGRWAFILATTCDILNCTDKEICIERSGNFGCSCAEDNSTIHSLDNFEFSDMCSGSSATVSLSRCQLFDAGFSPRFLHLNDPTCYGQIVGERVVFHFDNNASLCGTNLRSNASHFIYENSIQAVSGEKSLISRDRWLNIDFSCVYPLTQSISMSSPIQAAESVVSRQLDNEGSYTIRMAPYPNSSFITPYLGEVSLGVNQQMYVAVQLDGVDRSQIATVLDNCWATPVNEMNHNVRWNLITNECPSPKDGTVRVLQNGVSTSAYFSFRMFTFTAISDKIFLHCKVHLCLLKGGQCARQCKPGHISKRRRRSVAFRDTASISLSF